jgi:hypothetical protein
MVLVSSRDGLAFNPCRLEPKNVKLLFDEYLLSTHIKV